METYKERMERKEKRKDCAAKMLKEKAKKMLKEKDYSSEKQRKYLGHISGRGE